MMHRVEEVSTQLQPVQVLTGLRLLAPCAHSRYPCTLGGSEARMGEQQSREVCTLCQPLQSEKKEKEKSSGLFLCWREVATRLQVNRFSNVVKLLPPMKEMFI